MVDRQRGAYAVIHNERGELLLVRAANGRFYLPGGRLEAGEDSREALRREIAEECGWSVEVGVELCRSRQPILDGRVYLDARYWRAALGRSLGQDGEHDMLWVDPDEALVRLHRRSDRVAVQFSTIAR